MKLNKKNRHLLHKSVPSFLQNQCNDEMQVSTKYAASNFIELHFERCIGILKTKKHDILVNCDITTS